MLAKFNSVLKSRYVPSTAYIRFEPLQIKKYFIFKSLAIKRKDQLVNIKSELQYELYRSLCDGKFYNQVIGISGIPNDILAQQVATLILYSNFNRIDGEFEWFNTGYVKPRSDDPKIIIIYNVVPERDRIYQIRDLLDKYPRALRLVIVSGLNALNYFDNYLYYPISGMIHLEEVRENLPDALTVKYKKYPVFNVDSILEAL